MKNKKLRILFLLIPALLLLWYQWYSRPQTLETLFPDFPWDNFQGISGNYLEYVPRRDTPGMLTTENGSTTLIPDDDPGAREIIDRLLSQTFEPIAGSPAEYLPVQEGDFMAELRFEHGAQLVRLCYRFGELTVSQGDTEYFCDFTGHEETAKAVFTWLKAQAAAK